MSVLRVQPGPGKREIYLSQPGKSQENELHQNVEALGPGSWVLGLGSLTPASNCQAAKAFASLEEEGTR